MFIQKKGAARKGCSFRCGIFDKLLLSEGDKLRRTVTISDPLVEDFSVMRTKPLNGNRDRIKEKQKEKKIRT